MTANEILAGMVKGLTGTWTRKELYCWDGNSGFHSGERLIQEPVKTLSEHCWLKFQKNHTQIQIGVILTNVSKVEPDLCTDINPFRTPGLLENLQKMFPEARISTRLNWDMEATVCISNVFPCKICTR